MPAHEVVDFWDIMHSTRNQLYLSTELNIEAQWDMMDVKTLFAAQKNVLYIGVGCGESVIDLANQGMNVYALDISTLAETCVKNYVKGFYLDAADLPKNTLDIVISRLVTQHMNDEDLAYQIQHVLKAMKKSGLFSMQFFMLDEGQTSLLPGLANDDIVAQRSGHVGRTQKQMQQIIESNGGTILKWGQTISFNELPGQPKWQIVHFGK